jgi:hypothetical protein
VGRISQSVVSSGVILAIAFSTWAWWQWMYPTCSFNYKLTVTVTTPDGPKVGSSIVKLKHSSAMVPGFARRGYVEVTGEAVYVELDQGRNLFVTLTNLGSGRRGPPASPLEGALNAEFLPRKAFGLNFWPGQERELCHAVALAKEKGPMQIAPQVVPTTVTFQSLQDPKSVENLDPSNMVQTLGPDVSLASVTVEITDQHPQDRIRSVLPWLSSFPEPGLAKLPDPSLPKILQELRHGHFTMNGVSEMDF